MTKSAEIENLCDQIHSQIRDLDQRLGGLVDQLRGGGGGDGQAAIASGHDRQDTRKYGHPTITLENRLSWVDPTGPPRFFLSARCGFWRAEHDASAALPTAPPAIAPPKPPAIAFSAIAMTFPPLMFCAIPGATGEPAIADPIGSGIIGFDND